MVQVDGSRKSKELVSRASQLSKQDGKPILGTALPEERLFKENSDLRSTCCLVFSRELETSIQDQSWIPRKRHRLI